MSLLITISCGIAAQLGPVKVYKQHMAEGLFVCNDETNRVVQVTVPPVQGQFMAQTRDEIVDLFDFDGRPESKGAWFWKETTQKEPVYQLKMPENSLPIMLTTSSGVTGIQGAEIQYGAGKLDNLPMSYSCNGKNYQHGQPTQNASGSGVGACLTMTGAKLTINLNLPVQSVTRLTGCIGDVIESKTAQEKRYEFEARDCDLDVRILTVSGPTYGRIVYRVTERTGLLPKPIPGRWPFDSVANAEDARGYYSWGSKGQFSWRRK